MQINTRVMFVWKNIEAALLKGAIFQVFWRERYIFALYTGPRKTVEI